MHNLNYRFLNVANAVAALSVAALGFVGCSGSDDPPAASGGASGNTGGSSGNSGGSSGNSGSSGSSGSSGAPGAKLYGTFKATLKEPELGAAAYTKFDGRVYDAPNPSPIVLKVDREQGGCQLMVPKSAFCEPDCLDGVCTSDGVCTPYAGPVYVGKIQVTGLGPTPVEIDAEMPAYSYQPVSALPNPPCSEGDTVSIGSDRFNLQGKCITKLDLLGADPIPVQAGKGVPLTWTPPGTPGNSRISIYLDVAHHGGKKGEIDCDVPDTGSFEIPEPLVTRLVGLGLAGFPTVEVTRYSSATSDKESEVKLVVASFVSRGVETGVKSCTDASECPTGQMCQADLTCK